MNRRFFLAATRGDITKCIALYHTADSHIDINMRHGPSGMTPLSGVITGSIWDRPGNTGNRRDVLEYLIRIGADASIVNGNGTTALQLAIDLTDMEFVDILLEQCSDIDIEKRFNGETPLCRLCPHCHQN